MIINTIPVNEYIAIREISFHELKNITKMLLTDEHNYRVDVINQICKQVVIKGNCKNVLDIVFTITTLRNTIFGNNLSYKKNGTEYTDDLTKIFNNKISFNPAVFKSGDYKISFIMPSRIPKDEYDILTACLYKINDDVVQCFTDKQKGMLLDNLPIPLKSLYTFLSKEAEKQKIVVSKNIEFSLYDSSALDFLTSILYEDLEQLLKFEFLVKQRLNMTADDLKTYTYPELKYFINVLNKQEQDENDS
jgi:hypothetical protein